MTHLQHYPSITGEICENAKIKRGKSQYFIKMVECHLQRVQKMDHDSYFQSQYVCTGKCKIFASDFVKKTVF